MVADLFKQLEDNSRPGPHYESDLDELDPAKRIPVRAIAFYLPQYHRIDENDEWWGRGFTEWTNVTKAIPRFKGHYQPHLPIHLGFYDVQNDDVLREQFRLVGRSGLSGLCFHHYWFSGKRLLRRPLDFLLNNPDIDLQFCINWANENWTRRWDGLDQSVLIKQKDKKNDGIDFARSIEHVVADRRYIKVGGRPLIMIYRPALIPNLARIVDQWRRHFSSLGLGTRILLCHKAGIKLIRENLVSMQPSASRLTFHQISLTDDKN